MLFVRSWSYWSIVLVCVLSWFTIYRIEIIALIIEILSGPLSIMSCRVIHLFVQTEITDIIIDLISIWVKLARAIWRLIRQLFQIQLTSIFYKSFTLMIIYNSLCGCAWLSWSLSFICWQAFHRACTALLRNRVIDFIILLIFWNISGMRLPEGCRLMKSSRLFTNSTYRTIHTFIISKSLQLVTFITNLSFSIHSFSISYTCRIQGWFLKSNSFRSVHECFRIFICSWLIKHRLFFILKFLFSCN